MRKRRRQMRGKRGVVDIDALAPGQPRKGSDPRCLVAGLISASQRIDPRGAVRRIQGAKAPLFRLGVTAGSEPAILDLKPREVGALGRRGYRAHEQYLGGGIRW